MYNLQYFDQVFTDIQEAKIWYKVQKEDLEVEFAIAIETAIQKVLKCLFLTLHVTKMFVLHTQKHFLLTFIFILMNLMRQ